MRNISVYKNAGFISNRCIILFSVCLSFIAINDQLHAQESKVQSIRGQVFDDASRSPVAGVTIQVEGLPALAAVTNDHGRFVLENVPLGRQTLRISGVGYEEQSIPEVLVTSGKEVVLNINIIEKINTLNEVVIAGKGKRTLNNEMVTVSGTSFNPGDTRRYAGAIGDPSRMISNVAGVASASDSRNDIVVRGNSPAGLLWLMEGINIPNPNHYGSLSSTGGPVSILNSNNLDRSDFLTGAFPAQYGNALASVFDLRLRNGNSYKTEMLAEISFTGFEAGMEGPFSQKSDASYVINYRYSTVGILNSLGFNIGTGTASPIYQDLNFKVYIPLSRKNKLSVWGIGGPSRISFYGNDEDTTKNENLYGSENENLLTRYFTAIGGINLETNFSNKTYGKLSLGFSTTNESIKHDSISTSTREAFRDWESRYNTNRYELSYFLTHKLDAKNNFVAGVSGIHYQFSLLNKRIFQDAPDLTRIDQTDNTSLLQAYAQWKHRFSNKLSFNAGLHYQYLSLNGSGAIEPRLAVKYDISGQHSVGAAYGLHSQMQALTTYFTQTHTNTGITYTNKNLDFTRSRHMVLNYTYKISPALILKAEAYYQTLHDVPVTTYSSGYSALNDGANFGVNLKDSLVNKGSGRNYGLELTIEKYFSNNYYFMLTGSLYDSKYKGSDGIERNTAFNSGYIYNILAGKDFIVGKNRSTLSINFKLTGVGGKYISPIDIPASTASGETVYDEKIAPFSLRQSPYFRADLKMGYRRNFRKSTLEGGIDLRNFTNHENIFIQNYNRRTNTIVNQYQQGFLPVPYFRFTF